MVIELVLTFKDEYLDGENEPLEFTHTLNAPAGFAVTGGQIFIENPTNSDLKRFAFRVDHEDNGNPKLTILEDVKQ